MQRFAYVIINTRYIVLSLEITRLHKKSLIINLGFLTSIECQTDFVFMSVNPMKARIEHCEDEAFFSINGINATF